jgi:phage tail sheath protein FI
MPTTPTYPGVYIEEIPSGVRTITGVATSITAFIGRAIRGPVDEPRMINSFGDFERIFGELDPAYPMSYAVKDFYLNGGSQGIIVRLYNKPDDPKLSKSKLNINGLSLEAAYEGSWGNSLRARADNKISTDMASSFNLDASKLFNLTVCDTSTGLIEEFRNVTGEESPRRIDRVLKNESNLVRIPESSSVPFTVPTPHADPASGKTVWEDDNASTKVADADKADNGKSIDSTAYIGSKNDKTGLYALKKADLFNLLCIPPDKREDDTPEDVYQEAMKFCVDRRAMLIVDAPKGWKSASDITKNNNQKLNDLGLTGTDSRNAAIYFPRVIQPDPKRKGQLDTFIPCGIIAGVIARTDQQRGLWKAPAGLDASLNGIQGLEVNLTDAENGMLNPLGINCLRSFPVHGRVVWGSRTLRGADQMADEYKYVPVRRLALYIEESLYRGTQWVVFEPNDEPLWAQIRLNVGAFMHSLFRQGAFQGKTPSEAYLVKCDKETTTQDDRNRGIVNILVGFAPLKPAEFVIIKIQQLAGQIQT